MSFDVQINGLSVRHLLSSAPKINDQLEAACRTLDLTARSDFPIPCEVGQRVELWVNGSRWFYGFLFRISMSHIGEEQYKAFDPMIYFKKNEGDFHFANMTLTQIFQALCDQIGVAKGPMINTGSVLPESFFQRTSGDKVAFDSARKAMQDSGRKFWYRFDPYVETFGVRVFERVVPEKLWLFERGVNLVSASYERSIEEMSNVVKLINRDTGKVVTRADTDSIRMYGQMVKFEEVSKDEVDQMERIADEKLGEHGEVRETMPIEAINPDGKMPQFFSGDWVYVEDDYTSLIGAYNVINVSHEFVSDALIKLSMDLQYDIKLPTAKYKKNTSKDPSAKKARKKKATKSAAPVAAATAGNYSPEVKAVIERYTIK